jgi:glycosyltransferase involved in cell wall biosynthesis
MFIAVSNAERDNLIQDITSESKVVRIDNGVDLPDIQGTAREKKIVFSARVAEQKGWNLFLEIAGLVLKEDPGIRFLFAGGGPDLNRMREQASAMGISESVSIPGYMPGAAAEYGTACASAVTSRWEGQPYSVLESMAYGCPVAAFDIPGVNELVEDGVTGCLIQPYDCRTFAVRLLEIAGDSGRASLLGQGARGRIREHYTRERFLKNMKDFYTRTGGRD